MSNNRTLGNLGQLLDSPASGSAVSKRNGSISTIAMTDSDVGGVATSGFTDSNLIKNIIDINHITKVGGIASSSDGLKAILQGNAPTALNPSASATYDLGDSSNPIDEIILDSSATIYFGELSMTSLLMSGTSANVSSGAGGGAAATWYGDRAVIAGGTDGGRLNTISYFSISTTGTVSDFGDLVEALNNLNGGASDGTYGVFGGGNAPSASFSTNIEYVTIATPSNASDFGDLTLGRDEGATASNGTYGLTGGGNSGTVTDTIDYVTIATPSNSTDFGNLSAGSEGICATGDLTYIIFAGGQSYNTSIQYVTADTPSNATSFGTLGTSTDVGAALSDDTYSLFGGGAGATNTINYVTTATTSNSSDFGDLTVARLALAPASNGTRGTFSGGYLSPNYQNVIDYVTIATPSNATDWGDLLIARNFVGGCSGSPS